MREREGSFNVLCCLGCNYGCGHVTLYFCSPRILFCLFHIHPDGRKKKNLQHICQKKETLKTSRGPDVMSNLNLLVTEQTCSTSLLKKEKKKALEPNKL